MATMMAGKIIACLERSFQKGDSATQIKGREENFNRQVQKYL
jgi:hypothetical protein